MNQLQGMKIAILVAEGFEQVEMEKPRQALEEAGAKTFIISCEDKEVQGWNHFDKGDTFKIDVPLKEANPDDYDALVLPGGVVNPDKLRLIPEAIDFIKQITQQNKPVAAICHGPWTLINAGAVKGRKVTSWASLQTDLKNAGATWVNEPVVCDGKLVTSRNPNDIPQFNKAMIELFQKEKD